MDEITNEENQISKEEEIGVSEQVPTSSPQQSPPAEPEKKSSIYTILGVLGVCCIGIILVFVVLSLIPMDWTVNGYQYYHRSLMDIIMNG